jgi:hypothetical protein
MLLVLAGAHGLAGSEATVDFVRDIRPILADTCIECHGEQKQKGDLRLDSREAALRGGSSGPAVVPNDSAKSLLIKRVLGEGDDPRMPKKKDPLTAQQIALLTRWIDQGATWPESAAKAAKPPHWSYVRPVQAPPPPVRAPAWARTPIDRFVLARLEREGLAPEAEADRATLIRRVSLDLVGLPPTPAEVDAFAADRAPDAYERLVDRLLASPHFGERWARPWLDLARYADTQGYEKDRRRDQWAYRDWVIGAYNADLPFDQFTIEQLAGDMLPNPTQSQRIATGFHRNTMLNEEDGVDRGELRWNILVERVGTTSEVWLGSTLQCAQCHNHKYDPFLQREFYQMLAFFDNADEPSLPVVAAGEAEARRTADERIAALKRTLDTDTPELATAQAAWEKTASVAASWTALDIQQATSAAGTVLARQGDGSILASRPAAKDVYELSARTTLRTLTALRLEVLPDPGLPASGPGAAGNGNFVLSGIRVQVRSATGLRPIALKSASADFSQQGWPVADAIDGKDDTGWAIQPETGKAHAAVFTAEPSELPPDATLVVTLVQRSPHAQHLIGRLRLAATAAADPGQGQSLPAAIQAILATGAGQRSEAQRRELAGYYRSIAPALAEARARLATLEAELKSRPATTALVMQERPRSTAPVTNIRIRGAYLAKGDEVAAGVPAALPPLPAGQVANRLALARWLVDAGNPLTARVTVNRLWEQLFGKGIVESSDDFGVQGQPPSHPELLDWLACEFMRQGWRTKAMLRLMVTSATYRQAAQATPAKLERDPANRLLSRGPRFRVEAEMLRDIALAASGLLSAKIGGPSVFPLQPDGIWNIPYNADRWVASAGEDRHRRGLYTFWRRTSPYPSFITFDAPSREVCTLRRPRTNTPLQALTLLNDPAFVEAARALARRMAGEGGPGAEARCAYGYRLCTSHAPAAADLAVLTALHARERQRYAADQAAAEALIQGEHPGLEAADLAALVVVANALLNLDESITKE